MGQTAAEGRETQGTLPACKDEPKDSLLAGDDDLDGRMRPGVGGPAVLSCTSGERGQLPSVPQVTEGYAAQECRISTPRQSVLVGSALLERREDSGEVPSP